MGSGAKTFELIVYQLLANIKIITPSTIAKTIPYLKTWLNHIFIPAVLKRKKDKRGQEKDKKEKKSKKETEITH